MSDNYSAEMVPDEQGKSELAGDVAEPTLAAQSGGEPPPAAPVEQRKSLEEIKAEARAYALSSTTTSKKKSKSWSKPPAAAPAAQPHPYPPGRYAYYPYGPPPPGYPPYHYGPPPSGAPAPGAAPADPSSKTQPPSSTTQPPPPGHHHAPPPGYPPHYYPYPPPQYPYHHAPPPPAGAATRKSPPPPAAAEPKAAAASEEKQDVSEEPPPPQEAASAAAVRTRRTPSKHVAAPPAAVPFPVADNNGMDRQISLTADNILRDENLDDYGRFVKGLNLLETHDVLQLFQDDDEDEYKVQEEEEEAGDDDDGGEDENESGESMEVDDQTEKDESGTATETSQEAAGEEKDAASGQHEKPASDVGDSEDVDDETMYQELAEELGWLEEEDIEAAVASLLGDAGNAGPNATPASRKATNDSLEAGGGDKLAAGAAGVDSAGDSMVAPIPPSLRVSRTGVKPKINVTIGQQRQLKQLLQQHYQLLVQQSVLAVRAAHYHRYHRSRTDRTDLLAGGETSDDLVEILDAAVGMVQDLDQNRMDAIRSSFQLNPWKRQRHEQQRQSQRRQLPLSHRHSQTDSWEGRLTRAQFHKMVEQEQATNSTVFDIRGLLKLGDTFELIDRSVRRDEDSDNDTPQLLDVESNKDACEYVLSASTESYDKSLVPGSRDISENFCSIAEFLGEGFTPPTNEKQQVAIRRNRSLFTAGEDNLVLRGVNLYGEKTWSLISDRFLPERSTNVISQRYNKLCLMLYRANGVKIHPNGTLDKPPKLESIDDIDEKELKKLSVVRPPAILNVHRWSLEEDLTLLKAVPITGHMWAELGARLIPHRDRGHLRKRYQVLERRIKSTVERTKKREYMDTLKDSRPSGVSRKPKASQAQATPPRSEKPPPTPQHTAATTNSQSNQTPSSYHYSPPPHGYYPPPYPPYGSPPPYPYPYPPHPYSPYGHPAAPYHDPYMGEDGSRAAFEKLAREGPEGSRPAGDSTNQGWSQMHEMIKNDNAKSGTATAAEEEVAKAMAMDLARSPAKPEVGMKTQENEESKREAKETKKGDEPQKDGGDSDVAKAGTDAAQEESSSDRKSAPEKDVATPVKAHQDASEESDPNRETPARDPTKGAIFTTDGTQIGLSPAFQTSPDQNAWPRIPTVPSPAMQGMSMHSFPAHSQMVGFSPAQPNPSPQAVMTPQGHNVDPAALDRSGGSTHSKRKALFREGPITSTLSENDLEAISGLNHLASSPAVPPPGSVDPTKDQQRNDGESSAPPRASSSAAKKRKGSVAERKEEEEEEEGESRRPSLFSKVVGDKNRNGGGAKKKKRKLVF